MTTLANKADTTTLASIVRFTAVFLLSSRASSRDGGTRFHSRFCHAAGRQGHSPQSRLPKQCRVAAWFINTTASRKIYMVQIGRPNVPVESFGSHLMISGGNANAGAAFPSTLRA